MFRVEGLGVGVKRLVLSVQGLGIWGSGASAPPSPGSAPAPSSFSDPFHFGSADAATQGGVRAAWKTSLTREEI